MPYPVQNLIIHVKLSHTFVPRQFLLFILPYSLTINIFSSILSHSISPSISAPFHTRYSSREAPIGSSTRGRRTDGRRDATLKLKGEEIQWWSWSRIYIGPYPDFTMSSQNITPDFWKPNQKNLFYTEPPILFIRPRLMLINEKIIDFRNDHLSLYLACWNRRTQRWKGKRNSDSKIFSKIRRKYCVSL